MTFIIVLGVLSIIAGLVLLCSTGPACDCKRPDLCDGTPQCCKKKL